MKKIVLVLMIGALAVVAAKAGRSVWMEVAKDKAVAKIDSLLGCMEVKRKQIELSVSGLKDGLHQLRKAKIVAQVKLEQIDHRAALVEQETATVDSVLSKLRDHLDSERPLETAGRVYQPQVVQTMAATLIHRRKDQSDQLSGFRQAQGRLTKVVSALGAKQSEYEKRLAGIEGQLIVIDTNRTALSAIKEAAKAMSDSDSGLAQKVGQLEEQVSHLYAEIEAELRMEDAQWNIAQTKSELGSADAILNAVRTPTDMMREIDALVGTSVSKAK